MTIESVERVIATCKRIELMQLQLLDYTKRGKPRNWDSAAITEYETTLKSIEQQYELSRLNTLVYTKLLEYLKGNIQIQIKDIISIPTQTTVFNESIN